METGICYFRLLFVCMLDRFYALFNHNVPSRLSPQGLCGNSCMWLHNVQLQIPDTNKLKSAQQANLEM